MTFSTRPAIVICVSLTIAFMAEGCKMTPEPPVARIEPASLERHGDVRQDNYYWMREREDPEVRAYLEAENAYTNSMMGHTEDLQNTLFEEFKTRIKQTDESVPYRIDDYFYYSRVVEGKDYPIYCRKRGSLEAPEEVMVDANELAAGHGFYSLRTRVVSPGQDILAFAEDTVGRRFYTIRFKDLGTGELLPDRIPDVTANMVWANDNRTIFYAKQDPTTLRWNRIYRHTLGEDPASDELVYQEDDVTFSCWVSKTKSRKYILVGSYQTLSTEYRYLDADRPNGRLTLIEPRARDHEYSVDHGGDAFYIRTNNRAKNFRLMKAPVRSPGLKNWKEVIPHQKDILLENFEIFRDHLVLVERKAGLITLRIRPWSGQTEHYLDFGEPAYLAYLSDNHMYDTPLIRYGYSSMTTPNSTIDYNMATRQKTVLKEDEVLGGFDKENYVTERLLAPARDGNTVPVSVVYRKDYPRDGSRPLLLYGYGSYGVTIDASFSPYRVSLLDRGFAFAIAHVRGGEDLGRQWYEDGKLLKKKNTFTDFIDCGRYLVDMQYTSPDRLFAQGGSAGGLLIGAVINMEPGLFRGVLAAVPFVDVVTTMLDDSIPLTTSEYDEWGDPSTKEHYEYILSYSPYDQVERKSYPNILVTTSFHDSQVQYWEPAKWVAKLRALKTDSNQLLLRTRMQAGHGGASARYDRYKDIAFEYAFFLDLAGTAR